MNSCLESPLGVYLAVFRIRNMTRTFESLRIPSGQGYFAEPGLLRQVLLGRRWRKQNVSTASHWEALSSSRVEKDAHDNVSMARACDVYSLQMICTLLWVSIACDVVLVPHRVIPGY